MTAKLIFSRSDVAVALGVTYESVTRWVVYQGIGPKPAYETPGGATFWTEAGLARWHKWYAKRPTRGKYDRAGTRKAAVQRRRDVMAGVVKKLEQS